MGDEIGTRADAEAKDDGITAPDVLVKNSGEVVVEVMKIKVPVVIPVIELM